MIGFIRGILLEKEAPQILVDVQGVGYEIDTPLSTFNQLPANGTEIKLFTHLVIREDAHQLYGFYTKKEQLLFRILLKVNGVGPRLALTVLSSVAPYEFVSFVMNNDAQSLTKLPGIGKKTAERLLIEMRDKLADWTLESNSETLTGSSASRQQILKDAISALVSLGYKQAEANRIVQKVDDGALSSEAIIRISLRELM